MDVSKITLHEGIMINVHIYDANFQFSIGTGNQTFRWLGVAALQHFNSLRKMGGRLRCREPYYNPHGEYLPSNVALPNENELSDPVLPDAKLNAKLKDGDHVYIDVNNVIRLNKIALPEINRWSLHAFYRTEDLVKEMDNLDTKFNTELEEKRIKVANETEHRRQLMKKNSEELKNILLPEIVKTLYPLINKDWEYLKFLSPKSDEQSQLNTLFSANYPQLLALFRIYADEYITYQQLKEKEYFNNSLKEDIKKRRLGVNNKNGPPEPEPEKDTIIPVMSIESICKFISDCGIPESKGFFYVSLADVCGVVRDKLEAGNISVKLQRTEFFLFLYKFSTHIGKEGKDNYKFSSSTDNYEKILTKYIHPFIGRYFSTQSSIILFHDEILSVLYTHYSELLTIFTVNCPVGRMKFETFIDIMLAADITPPNINKEDDSMTSYINSIRSLYDKMFDSYDLQSENTMSIAEFLEFIFKVGYFCFSKTVTRLSDIAEKVCSMLATKYY